jgi:diphthamide biosynthesis protein 7
MSPASFDTDYPADSLEFCPNDGYKDLFVCGTYKLIERQPPPNEAEETPPPTKRLGQCLVFRMKDLNPGEISSDELPLYDTALSLSLYIRPDTLSSRHTQSLDFPAIPDMKWSVSRKQSRISGCSCKPGVMDLDLINQL